MQGQGRRFFVLRLSPSNGAQLWDPLKAEATLLTSGNAKTDEGTLSVAVGRERAALVVEEEAILRELREGYAKELALTAAAETRRRSPPELSGRGFSEKELRQHLEELRGRQAELRVRWHEVHALLRGGASSFVIGRATRLLAEEDSEALAAFGVVFGCQNAYLNKQLLCRKPRHGTGSLAWPHPRVLFSEEAPKEDSLADDEAEQSLRREVNDAIRRRHERRCLGFPKLFASLKRRLHKMRSSAFWLDGAVRCVGLLCCER